MMSSTMFGWPAADGREASVGVIGVPSDAGNGIASGSRLAPAAIREASLAMGCVGTGVDHGDIDRDRCGDWDEMLIEAERRIADLVNRGVRPIILGGDHGISYAGVAAAACYPRLNVVWFDAHTDFCRLTDADRHDHKQVLRRIADLRHVGRILQVGHRGITYFDEIRRFPRLTIIPAHQAYEIAADSLLEYLPADEPVYISIDIDALDPCCAPGTGHPVPGGFEVERLTEFAREIVDHRHVIAIDLTEVNPLFDPLGTTSAAAATLLAALAPGLCRPPSGPGDVEQHEAATGGRS